MLLKFTTLALTKSSATRAVRRTVRSRAPGSRWPTHFASSLNFGCSSLCLARTGLKWTLRSSPWISKSRSSRWVTTYGEYSVTALILPSASDYCNEHRVEYSEVHRAEDRAQLLLEVRSKSKCRHILLLTKLHRDRQKMRRTFTVTHGARKQNNSLREINYRTKRSVIKLCVITNHRFEARFSGSSKPTFFPCCVMLRNRRATLECERARTFAEINYIFAHHCTLLIEFERTLQHTRTRTVREHWTVPEISSAARYSEHSIRWTVLELSRCAVIANRRALCFFMARQQTSWLVSLLRNSSTACCAISACLVLRCMYAAQYASNAITILFFCDLFDKVAVSMVCLQYVAMLL